MNRRLTVMSVLAAAMLGLVACSDPSVGGTPSPSAGGPAPTVGDGGTPSSSAPGGAGGSSLASLQPCDLLSASEQSQLEVFKTGSGDDSGARHCDYRKNVDSNGRGGYAFDVGIRDKQGMSSADTTNFTVSPTTIGNHQGEQLRDSGNLPGNCLVIIAVTATSRVDVSVNANLNTDTACQVANTVAKAVEPELPAGS